MLVQYRIRGGQPPNRGGQLLVDRDEQTAKWYDQDSPGKYQMIDYTKIGSLLREFEAEGAIIVKKYYPQTWWETFKHMVTGD